MYTSKIGKRHLSHRTKFAVVSCNDLSKYDKFETEIVEAFHIMDGVRGIMAVTDLAKTTAYLLAAKFGLIREKVAKRNTNAYSKRRLGNLEHLKNVWDWEPGSEIAVLKRKRQYVASVSFSAGGAYFKEGEIFLQYTLPSGKVRKYLTTHGVKWFIAGSEIISVNSIKGKGTSLSAKLENLAKTKVDCKPN